MSSSPVGFTLAVLFACVVGLALIDACCSDKYEYKFLARPGLMRLALAQGLICFGMWACYKHGATLDDRHVGWLVNAIGLLIVAFSFYRNVQGTNLWIGMVGTVCQLPVAMSMIVIGFCLLVLKQIEEHKPESYDIEESERQQQLADEWDKSPLNPYGVNYKE